MSAQPHSHEIEIAVLGHLLSHNDAINRVLELIGPDDFFVDRNKRIFRAMVDLAGSDKAYDVAILSERLRQRSELERVGGVTCLSGLPAGAEDISRLVEYCRILRDKSHLRELVSLGTHIINQCNEPEADWAQICEMVLGVIGELGEDKLRLSFQPLKYPMEEVGKTLNAARTNAEQGCGILSGFRGLDIKTGGFKPGTVTLIAAGSSMGKTSMALNLVYNVGVIQNKAIGFYSLGLKAEQVCERLISAAAHIDTDMLRTGALPETDWQRLPNVMEKLSRGKIFVDDDADMSMMKVRFSAKRLLQEKRMELLVLDDVQLVKASNLNNPSVVLDSLRELKLMAKFFNVPVVVFYRLDGHVGDGRPDDGMLPHRDAIGRYYDLLLFLHREATSCDYCLKDDEVCPYNHGDRAEIVVARQNGSRGIIPVRFSEHSGKFLEDG